MMFPQGRQEPSGIRHGHYGNRVLVPDLAVPLSQTRAFYIGGRVWVIGTKGAAGQSWAPGEAAWRNETTMPTAQRFTNWGDRGMAIASIDGHNIVTAGGSDGNSLGTLAAFDTLTRTWSTWDNGINTIQDAQLFRDSPNQGIYLGAKCYGAIQGFRYSVNDPFMGYQNGKGYLDIADGPIWPNGAAGAFEFGPNLGVYVQPAAPGDNWTQTQAAWDANLASQKSRTNDAGGHLWQSGYNVAGVPSNRVTKYIGKDPTNHVETTMAVARQYHVAQTWGQKIIMAGGFDGAAGIDSIETLDAGSGVSSLISDPLRVGRWHACSVWIGNSLLIIGGETGGGTVGTVDVFQHGRISRYLEIE